MTRLLCGALLVLGLISQPVFAASDINCDIDESLNKSLETMNRTTAADIKNSVGTAIESAPTVKEASCLAILDQLDMLMRMRIPSMGGAMGGVMTAIRDMACDMANSYLTQLAGKAQVNVGDPFGVASVGIGATTGEGGMQTEEYDLGQVVGDAAASTIGGATRGSANEVLNRMPSGPANRSPRIESTVNSTVNGAINGL